MSIAFNARVRRSCRGTPIASKPSSTFEAQLTKALMQNVENHRNALCRTFNRLAMKINFVPKVAGINPAAMRSKVDLPEPERFQ